MPDVLVKQHIPSHERYRYVFFIVDHASKMCWVYPLQTRESKHVLGHLRALIQETILFIPLMHFYLKVNMCNSPRDTPLMNSVSGKKMRKHWNYVEKVVTACLQVSIFFDKFKRKAHF